MATAANEASVATSAAAKMIQDKAWGRGGSVEDRGGKHMAEWQKFFNFLPHHSEGEGIEDEHHHHGEDHNTHYFDHGEHGTGMMPGFFPYF